MQDVFLRASEYVSIILVPLIAITVILLADEIIMLIKRAITISRVRSRRR